MIKNKFTMTSRDINRSRKLEEFTSEEDTDWGDTDWGDINQPRMYEDFTMEEGTRRGFGGGLLSIREYKNISTQLKRLQVMIVATMLLMMLMAIWIGVLHTRIRDVQSDFGDLPIAGVPGVSSLQATSDISSDDTTNVRHLQDSVENALSLIQNLTSDLSAIQATNNLLREDLNNAVFRINTSDQSVDLIRDDLDNIDLRIKNLTSDRSVIDATTARIHTELDQTSQIRNITSDLSLIHSTNSLLRDDLDNAIINIQNLTSSLSVVHSTNNLLREDVDNNVKYIKNLTSDRPDDLLRDELDNTLIYIKTISQDESTSGIITEVQSGTTYVRWGRTVCNNDTARVVYNGIAAGAFGNSWEGDITEIGGGANYLCMTRDPLYMADATSQVEDPRSRIYGAEYRRGGGEDLHQYDVPCVVCETLGRRTQQILVPGTYRCPSGWTHEYNGLLNAARHNNPRTSYVCMDSAPEIIEGTDALDEKASYLFHVEGICSENANSGLPCGPYENGKEITCAVCSK